MSVWLCEPVERGVDPRWPYWARTLIEQYSAPGDRVIVRTFGSYPTLAGEVAALLGAARALGRHPVALLPTPASAARTRALLPPTPTPTPVPDMAVPDMFGTAMSGGHTDLTAAAGVRVGVATGADVATPGPSTAAPQPPGVSRQSVNDVAAATSSAVAGTGEVGQVRVGVGRRRVALEAGPAPLVVVLAGPVAAGARPARAIPAVVLRGWARALRGGGVMAVLAPSPLGRAHVRRYPGVFAGLLATGRPGWAAVAGALRQAGLSYLQHVVLVHAPVTDTGLGRPRTCRRPHAPFWPVHTDLFLGHKPPSPWTATTPPGPTPHREETP